MNKSSDILIIGAGSIGVSVAYYLKRLQPALSVTLLDSHQPLSFTSASSGENFRNWWPHPVLKNYFDHSLDLLDEQNRLLQGAAIVSKRGYLLASRERQPSGLLENLTTTFSAGGELREHSRVSEYQRALATFENGVDFIRSPKSIGQMYAGFSDEINSIWHIRRGGTLDAQQLGQSMLKSFRRAGGRYLQADVTSLEKAEVFRVNVTLAQATDPTENVEIQSDVLVNAAGPYAGRLSESLGLDLPLINIVQQKVAFEDISGVVDRSLPFCIDLDPASLNWTDEERALLGGDPHTAVYTERMPGAIHCRPEGSENGKWVKLGWAFNEAVTTPSREPELSESFPEIVLRGASLLQPGLARYIDGFPGGISHYGGHYTMTKENWPLLGDTPMPGYYIASGMSGFGSMAACGSGELLSRFILGQPVPDWFADLGLQRYENKELLAEIAELNNRGML